MLQSPLFYSLFSGAVAQLGERLPCTQEVRSSILLGSTNIFTRALKVKILVSVTKDFESDTESTFNVLCTDTR
jgi:hypothetical protein